MNYKEATRTTTGTKFTVGNETITKAEVGKAYDFINDKGEPFLDRTAVFETGEKKKPKAPAKKKVVAKKTTKPKTKAKANNGPKNVKKKK